MGMFDNWSMDNLRGKLPDLSLDSSIRKSAEQGGQQFADQYNALGPQAFNPDAMKGFDTTALAQAMRQNVAKGGAQARGRAAGAMQRGGIQGADQGRAIADIAGQEAASNQNNEANLAWQDYMNKYSQWKDMQGINERAQDRMTDDNRYNQQRQDQNNPLNFLGNVAGKALGIWGGNKLSGN